MKQYRYTIYFKNKRQAISYGFTSEQAKIKAQARAINDGEDYTVVTIKKDKT